MPPVGCTHASGRLKTAVDAWLEQDRHVLVQQAVYGGTELLELQTITGSKKQ